MKYRRVILLSCDMSLQIYKPNSKNTGCAISFQISQKGDKDPQFYVNCINQHSWDENKKTGSFAENRNDPSKTIAIKFNEFELGEFINAFANKSTYSTYHNSESAKTQIKISVYDKTKGIGEFAVTYKAFGLSFTRNGSDTFKVPIEPGEAVRISSYIERYYSILDDFRTTKQQSRSNAGGATSRESTKEAVVEKLATIQKASTLQEDEF